ncbi:MAG TPA: DUF4190 domain-containing protein [Actinomycetota bacterium]|nr:DUF4190 domain-containing protein [Actinomycetota bacterium]
MSYQPPPVVQPAQPNNSKAVTSLVLGIVGLVIWIIPLIGYFIALGCAIAAIVLGSKAKKEISASGGTQGGAGLATAGFVLGWIGVAFAIIGFVFGVLIGISMLGSGFGGAEL